TRITHDTIGNRRATRLLQDTADLGRELLASSSELPRRGRMWLEAYLREVHVVLDTFPFRNLQQKAVRLPDAPANEEVVEPNYQRVYELHRELVDARGWSPGTAISNRYAYIAHS